MQKKSKSEGSVYYNKSRNRFTVQYYENDIKTGKRKRKTKDFKTEEEGKKYLQNIMYQKQNPLYIEHLHAQNIVCAIGMRAPPVVS